MAVAGAGDRLARWSLWLIPRTVLPELKRLRDATDHVGVPVGTSGTLDYADTATTVDPPAAGPAVVAGWNHALVLSDTGVIWAWGSNSSGQVGNGTTTTQAVPVALSISGVMAIAADSNSRMR